MNNNRLDKLSNDEVRVFKLLESLDEGQHLTAAQIMDRLAMSNRRYLDSLILQLRSKGFPIISSKSYIDKGYWVATDRAELYEYLKSKECYINTHLQTIHAMRQAANDLF